MARRFVDVSSKRVGSAGEALAVYTDLFDECPLEVAKSLSKLEREENALTAEKSLIYGEVDFGSLGARAGTLALRERPTEICPR